MVYVQQRERRGWFVVLAVFIANLFLIAFGLDAGLSVADEVLKAGGLEALAGVRAVVASLVVVACLPVLLVLIVAAQLPKLLLLPPILLVLWFASGAPPFIPSAKGESLLGVSLIQLVMAVALFALSQARYGSWLIPADALPRRRYFSFGYLASVVALLVLVPAFVAVMSVYGAASVSEYETRHFIDFTSQGVDVRERVYRKDNSEVRLIAMIHIGNDEQYRSLFEQWPEGGLVLAEGVTDKNNLLKQDKLSYDRAAENVGLVGQPVLRPTLDHDGNPIAKETDGLEEDIGMPEDTPGLVRVKADVQYADVDMSDLSERTVTFIRDVGYLMASSSLSDIINRWSKVGPELSQIDAEAVMDEIVLVRNEHLLKEFEKQKSKYNVIIIPWGAMHMPGIEDALKAEGYEAVSDRMLPLIKYDAIFGHLAAAREEG